ncbi:MAG: hypothetical protein AAB530_03210 [Patescibacteria group bacterium]
MNLETTHQNSLNNQKGLEMYFLPEVVKKFAKLEQNEKNLEFYTEYGIRRRTLNKYFSFYNNERRHQSLNYLIPAEIYYK